MCEQFVARASAPFRLGALWPYAERVERFGIAGFGWGAAWLTPDGTLETHRSTHALRDDPARGTVGAIETTAALVHLRRPSKLSTLQLPDAQPFLDPAGRFAFAHNGDFHDYRRARARYAAQGRIHGRADSEAGQRWLEDAYSDSEPAGHLLAALHDGFGGEANLALLTSDGTPHLYAGNPENPVFTFRLGAIGVASTGIYSMDRSLFRFAAHGATERRIVRLHTTVALDSVGAAVDSARRTAAPAAR